MEPFDSWQRQCHQWPVMKTKDKQIITFSPSFLSFFFFLSTKDRFTQKQEVAALGSSFCAGWGCETGGAGGTLLPTPPALPGRRSWPPLSGAAGLIRNPSRWVRGLGHVASQQACTRVHDDSCHSYSFFPSLHSSNFSLILHFSPTLVYPKC